MGDLSIFFGSSQFFFKALKSCQIDLSLLFIVAPRYFMLFVAVVKYEVSRISASYSLSFVYMRGIYFFEFILHPAISLMVFISCSSYLEEFLWSLVYAIIPSANNKIFTFSVPSQILISLCFLI